ncbi:putative DNA binding domain-containing protein, partial [Candidatus Desantisbacteria bacterium]|nr:putative DNA binding domain-containing protein [Candidatus Desantisbacteria bacterium]
MTTVKEFNKWLKRLEDKTLEFKTATNSFSRDKDLPNYCAALANECGGKLILGVNNNREVVGTKAFEETYTKLSNELLSKIKIRVDVEELIHPDGRVLIFHVPSRPIGQAVRSTGNYHYPMRAGESLVEMDQMTLKRILNESEPDFSAQIVEGLRLDDLDKESIANFKRRWAEKARREDYLSFTSEKTLRSIGLLTDNGLNYASLILFGKKEKLDEFLPGSEIIFEWRHEARKTAYDFRKNWREPFFKICDEIWETINARNIRTPFQEGFFQREVYAFSEKPIREAVLNAVAHRDHTIQSQSIFIKASPEEFIIESPGGFPPGITIENILYKKYWRNRCIAETFEKAGLVERSGQGMDDIFEYIIKEGKGLPDLSKSDDFSVCLQIPAQVKDKNFILFLEKIINEKQVALSFDEIYELEKIRENQPVAQIENRNKFLEIGVIEQVGKTKGAKYILSHKYYVQEDKVGIHTRLVGISREKDKELILKHLEKNKGYRHDLQIVFPELNPQDISNILQELKREEKIKFLGIGNRGYWVLR